MQEIADSTNNCILGLIIFVLLVAIAVVTYVKYGDKLAFNCVLANLGLSQPQPNGNIQHRLKSKIVHRYY